MVTAEQLRKAANEAKAASLLRIQEKIAVLVDLLIQKSDEIDRELYAVEKDLIQARNDIKELKKNGEG
ncbi:hypothetical protein [Nitrosovibrio sp. Nv4]|uniref:hypothetical protein n=1 Tax=Nitrosovibrio sp. Nv4 TaxID=1945880 RepID=UPI000BCEBB44|nr:hypothetical protein [Nitrosovibrio sp. Nv4]SOD41616.1 hypothetical protein SAMN06298226_1918 [Nitrosovibrio sp. Nv4]